MKVKIWCEKFFITKYIKENINIEKSYITIRKEEIVNIDLKDIITELGHDKYYYTNNLYDLIHKKYKYIDLFTYNGDNLEYEIVEKGYKDDIPYLEEPLTSIEQFKEIMRYKND